MVHPDHAFRRCPYQGAPTRPANRKVTKYAAELAQKKSQALFRMDAATLTQIGALMWGSLLLRHPLVRVATSSRGSYKI